MYIIEWDEASPRFHVEVVYVEISLFNGARIQKTRAESVLEFLEWLEFQGILAQPLPPKPTGCHMGAKPPRYWFRSAWTAFLGDHDAVHFKLRWLGGPLLFDR